MKLSVRVLQMEFESVWTEHFRPEFVKDVILPTPYRRAFDTYVEYKDIPHMILYSSKPGTGKTSLAKALVNTIGNEMLFINASKNGSIDTLREKIQSFADFESLNGFRKVIILDEFDGSSQAMQNGLKSFIEEYDDNCRFIVTCNKMINLIEPLQSRCQIFDFNFYRRDWREEVTMLAAKRIAGILKIKEIPFDKEVLLGIVSKYFPDIRSIMNVCSQSFAMYGGIVKDSLQITAYDTTIIQMILECKVTDARQYMLNNGDYKGIFSYIMWNLHTFITKPDEVKIVPVISEHMWRESQGVIDSDINFYHMIIEIRKLLS